MSKPDHAAHLDVGACPTHLERYWRSKLVSRDAITNAMLEAELDLQGDWAVYKEAAKLTLAWIISKAVRRQQRGLIRVIQRKEYKRVAMLSRKLQDLLVSLQDTDCPPELLNLDHSGNTEWEAWAQLSVGLQPRGALSATDPYTLYELVAFYRLALQKKKFSFSRGETPQRKFLEIMFSLAREVYHEELKKTGKTGSHSLRMPGEEALIQAGKKSRDITYGTDTVLRTFAKYSTQTT